MAELGVLQRVELRDVWQHETHHFAPWLAQPVTLATLSDVLGPVSSAWILAFLALHSSRKLTKIRSAICQAENFYSGCEVKKSTTALPRLSAMV